MCSFDIQYSIVLKHNKEYPPPPTPPTSSNPLWMFFYWIGLDRAAEILIARLRWRGKEAERRIARGCWRHTVLPRPVRSEEGYIVKPSHRVIIFQFGLWLKNPPIRYRIHAFISDKDGGLMAAVRTVVFSWMVVNRRFSWFRWVLCGCWVKNL